MPTVVWKSLSWRSTPQVPQEGSVLDVALDQYPELSGDQGRARLVLARETGGRWSEEAHDFLRQLEGESALGAPRNSSCRWCTALACCAGRSRCRCWSAVAVVASTAKCPRLATSSGMTVARAEAIPFFQPGTVPFFTDFVHSSFFISKKKELGRVGLLQSFV